MWDSSSEGGRLSSSEEEGPGPSDRTKHAPKAARTSKWERNAILEMHQQDHARGCIGWITQRLATPRDRSTVSRVIKLGGQTHYEACGSKTWAFGCDIVAEALSLFWRTGVLFFRAFLPILTWGSALCTAIGRNRPVGAVPSLSWCSLCSCATEQP